MSEQAESIEINRLQELVNSFTSDQLAYLAVRPFVRWDKDAAEAVDLAKETVSRWENKADIDEAVRLMRMDGVIVALEILRRHLPRAAQEIVDELSHRNVGVRYKAATEIMDRAIGRAMQRQEVTGKDGGPIVIVNWDDNASDENED